MDQSCQGNRTQNDSLIPDIHSPHQCLTTFPHTDHLQPLVNPSDIPPVNTSSTYYDDFVYMHMDLNTHVKKLTAIATTPGLTRKLTQKLDSQHGIVSTMAQVVCCRLRDSPQRKMWVQRRLTLLELEHRYVFLVFQVMSKLHISNRC